MVIYISVVIDLFILMNKTGVRDQHHYKKNNSPNERSVLFRVIYVLDFKTILTV
jgi:hypothetical protein